MKREIVRKQVISGTWCWLGSERSWERTEVGHAFRISGIWVLRVLATYFETRLCISVPSAADSMKTKRSAFRGAHGDF